MDAYNPQPNRNRSNQASQSQALQLALQMGLAALKQRDYAAAVQHLELCQASPDPALRLKAEMGLIKAYAKTNQIESALTLCQPLQTHQNPQVQAWARQTFAELTAMDDPAPSSDTTRPPSPQPDPTGFVPLSSSSAPSRPTVGGRVPQKQTSAVRKQASHSPASHPQTTHRPTAPNQLAQASKSAPKSPPQPNSKANPKAGEDKTSRSLVVPTSPQPGNLELGSLQPINLQAANLQPIGSPPVPWRYAERSAKWSALSRTDASGLWALQAGSLVLLFWLVDLLLRGLFKTWNSLVIALYGLVRLPQFPEQLAQPLLVVLIGLALASPWLLDIIFRRQYNQQSLSLADLEQKSPEAVRLLKRVCGQRRQPLPTLFLLPTAAPTLFTYGYLPQQVRLVISQGLLKQLNPDEIAALLAGELAHVRYWDFAVLSILALVAQLPYLIYWQVASWGNHQQNRALQILSAIVSSLAYGLFWWLRLPTLWLSRVRLYYSDRLASELTGNPNGLTRALLKSALGIAEEIQQQKQTPALLESFEMLMPVGYRTALTFGSLYRGDPAVLNWDRLNPYRRWLVLNNTHPLLGERCQLLMQYARHWRLGTELQWEGQNTKILPVPQVRRRLLLQGAPYWGVPIGLGVTLALWSLGWLAQQFRWYGLSWLAGDRSILIACCLLGFSVGTFLRINAFFPDINRSNIQIDPTLSALLSDPASLPVDSQPVRLQGTLLGRSGLLNWLHRDLMLQTPTGLVRLHYTSRCGWLSDLLPQPCPSAWINRAVSVTGWFRHGATPWIDVETIQTLPGKTLGSQHPIWSTVAASLAALAAVYIIFRGGS